MRKSKTNEDVIVQWMKKIENGSKNRKEVAKYLGVKAETAGKWYEVILNLRIEKCIFRKFIMLQNYHKKLGHEN